MTIVRSELEKKAITYLRNNTTYPDWWIKEQPTKKLLAIYYSELKKKGVKV